MRMVASPSMWCSWHFKKGQLEIKNSRVCICYYGNNDCVASLTADKYIAALNRVLFLNGYAKTNEFSKPPPGKTI